MAKKSFFERLTGTIREEAKEREETEKKVSKNKKSSHPLSTKEEGTAEKTATETTVTKEEWSSAEEGQLTIDVYQTDTDVVIKSIIGGVNSEDIDITITNEMITIKGIRRQDESVPPENYDYKELYWGPFSRSIILPVDVDPDKAKASMKNGILTIRLPKIERFKTKTIKIKEEI